MNKIPWQPLAAYELKYTVLPGHIEGGRDKLAPVRRILRAVTIFEAPSSLVSTVFQTCSPQFTSIKPSKLGLDVIPVEDIFLGSEADGTLTGFGGLRLKIKPRELEIPALLMDESGTHVRPPATLNLIRITPRHLRLPDFPVLAAYLATQRVTISMQTSEREVLSRHRVVSVNALTAVLLVLKIHGDIGGVVHVLSLGPEAVASDIRRCSLGEAIGALTTCAALSSLFTHLAKQQYLPNRPALIDAAADLLAAHLGRQDFRDLFNAGKCNILKQKMRRLIDVQPLIKPDDPLGYARFAAIREGIVYGAMICFVQDQTRNRLSTIAIVAVFADTAVDFFERPATRLFGSSARSTMSIISLLLAPKRMLSGPRWSSGHLVQAIEARFEACVAGLAKRGWIAGWPHELKGADGLRIAQDYADEARRMMRLVSSRPSPVAVGSWREAIRAR